MCITTNSSVTPDISYDFLHQLDLSSVLRIRIRIRKDLHHFAGSGSAPKPMDPDPDPDPDPDADPTLFHTKLRKDVLQTN